MVARAKSMAMRWLNSSHLSGPAQGWTFSRAIDRALRGLVILLAVRAVLAGEFDIDSLNKIWSANLARGNSRPTNPLKILDWNIERGLQLSRIIETLRRENPDICILQEVDLNVPRTGAQNVAEVIARTLGLNYVYASAFQELGQHAGPSGPSPAYQGQAVLTRFPIRSKRILRFVHQSKYWSPRWYLPNWPFFQRRLGGRMALVAELNLDGTALVIYNTHLESRLSENGRLLQLREILADMRRYPPETSMVLAGDFNTVENPSSLIREIEQLAFRNAISTKMPTAPPRAYPASFFRRLLSPVIRIRSNLREPFWDWIFVRGPLRTEQGKVLQDVAASDHYPLSARISLVAP